jgi:Zn-dependent peptidase ImmA (M78 family)
MLLIKVAKPLSRKRIRDLTNNIREFCGKEYEHEFPIMHFLENIMCLIFDSFEIEILEDDEIDCEARAFPSKNLIKIRQSVYDGACNGNPRDRFTIAHEIGHMFLHDEESISFARGKDIEIKSYEDPEWQANTFAGELLAPPYLIKNLNTEAIMQKCKVSRSAAEIQKKYCN